MASMREPDAASQTPLLGDTDAAAEEPTAYGTAETHAALSEEEQQGVFKRNLGTIEAFAIIISIVVGSGIFTSPGAIDQNVPSPGAALLTWLIGGALAWTGAATLAELGTAIPGEGGVQAYLQYIFGDVFGFLAAWTWVVAVMPATLAILSIVFVDSILSAAGVASEAGSLRHKLLSIAILVVTNTSNAISTKASTRLNNFFVVTKFIGILAVMAAGLGVVIAHYLGRDAKNGGKDWFRRSWFENRDSFSPDGSRIVWGDLHAWEILGHFSTAIYASLWAYSGWDKAIYITAELSAPARQLPLAINSSIPTVVVGFVAANAAYYVLLPWNMISITDSVAVTAITRLLGRAFGIIAAVVVCLVVAGSLLGNSFVAGRMAVAAARRGWLPEIFGRIGYGDFTLRSTPSEDESSPEEPGVPVDDSKSDAPVYALILSTILSAVYIAFGNFRSLLTFNGMGEYSFFFLTVLGALVLRFRDPSLDRPYKPFIVIPLLFAFVSLFIVVRGATFEPLLFGVLALVWAVGLGFYVLRRTLAAWSS